MDSLTIYVLSVIFIATLVRSTVGFGESLIAVPLLIFFIPVEVAVPVSVLSSILIAAFIVVQDRKQIDFQSAKWLVVFAMIGIPIGLLLLVYGNENLLKLSLGIILIVYSTYSLLSKRKFELPENHARWLFICGFISGVFGGAYGLNGPPLVVYGNLRKWSAKKFRTTLQAYFLPTSIVGMLGYAALGLWSSTVTHYFLLSIPVIIPAILIGRYLNHQIKDRAFLNFIHVGLIAIGIFLMISIEG